MSAVLNLPSFMSPFEATECARRLLQCSQDDHCVKLLGLAVLYTSWEIENPCETHLGKTLGELPALVGKSAGSAALALQISPERVRQALEQGGVRPPESVTALNMACETADALFASADDFRRTYRTTQERLLRSPGAGAYLGEAMAISLGAAASKTPAVSVQFGSQLSTAPLPVATPEEQTSDGSQFAQHPLFDPREASKLQQRIGLEEVSAGLKRLLSRMSGERGLRPLSPAPEVDALDELQERFPHFAEVLSFVRMNLALSRCGTGPSSVYFPPLLLRGGPGLGKSYFAQELARALGCTYEERDLATTSEAFVLAGMDPSWKGSKAGLVFEAVYLGRWANPVLCLNEVDKAREGGSSNSPMSALFSLLEPSTSRLFKDEFVGLPVDASRVNWVLTANDGHIPGPVLDRLEPFDIPSPSVDQCVAIARSVWKFVCRQSFPSGHPFDEELAEELAAFASRLSPRAMRRAFHRAAGLAAIAGRNQLDIEDLESASKAIVPSGRRAIGFTA